MREEEEEEEEEEVEAGFAKLQGEDFEYYMQTYSIVLGRNSKKSTVDIDLFELGGGMNISRQHARIFYDFERRRFALEVIGKNGCHVSGVHYVPGDPPVKLGSQDLLQMGDKIFYFLLPLKKTRPKSKPQDNLNSNANMAGVHVPLALPPPASALGLARKKGSRKDNDARHQNYVDFDGYGDEPPAKKGRSEGGYAMKLSLSSGSRKPYQQAIMQSCSHLPQKQGFPYHSDQKGDSRRRGDHEADTFQQKQEEQDVVSAVATLLSDLCGPGEWMPVAKLHSELVEHYSGIWHQSRIRKFLSGDDRVDSESKRKPWCGLLSLLRKYPEHFVINTSKGRVIAEFVSLVSLLS